MESKDLFAITGVFDNPEDIINAAEKAEETGYTKYDINTPYPIHGLDHAMRLGQSKLGYVALVAGLSALFGSLLLLWWITGVDYPLIIGGKPSFSFPALGPVLFELTVLIASIVTVVTMLFVFFKLPNNSFPLHGTEYMKMVSNDKYGISIQASDPKFNEEDVRSFLNNLGAQNIQTIYYDEEDLSATNRVFEPRFLMFLAFVFLLTVGTTYFGFNIMPNITPFNFMMYQKKHLPQQTSAFFADGFSMRPPVEGTVARGLFPYMFKGNQADAAKYLSNPLIPSKQNLERGRTDFNIFCSPCHGYLADGKSRLHGQFPNPPTLHTDKVRNWTDADIFNVITSGQNIMPSYASQIRPDDRWAIILYIRALQRSQNAKETDLQ